MKIVSWNVNSLKARRELVEHYLDEERPDVLGIQELKLATDMVPTEIFESRGYHVAVHGQKQWNGVLLASLEPLTQVVTGFPGEEEQARLVAATVAGIRIFNLYCPQGQSADSDKFQYKLRFYDALGDWLEQNEDPEGAVVVMGDLNIAPLPRDVHDPQAMFGVPTFHPRELERWGRLAWWGLQDTMVDRLAPGTFSFWDYRDGAFGRDRGFRIDHVLATAPVAERVREVFIQRDWRAQRTETSPSDHAPVGVTLAAGG